MTTMFPKFPSPAQLTARARVVADAIRAGDFAGDGLHKKFVDAMADDMYPAGIILAVNKQLAGTAFEVEAVEEKKEVEAKTNETTIVVKNGTLECCRFTVSWKHR